MVALRKESVDRNITALAVLLMYSVALRKESVDRNSKIAKKVLTSMVALRKESVDRNRDNEMALQEGMSRSPQGERG